MEWKESIWEEILSAALRRCDLNVKTEQGSVINSLDQWSIVSISPSTHDADEENIKGTRLSNNSQQEFMSSRVGGGILQQDY